MIDIVIRYTHSIAGDEYYDVYAEDRHIGILTTCLSSGYRFEPSRKAPITNFHTFKSLEEAIERLPNFLVDWLALAALSTIEA